MLQATLSTPVGQVVLTEENEALTRLSWGSGGQDDSPLLNEARAQLLAYFEHRLTEFDLPMRITGSDFQQAVCAQMAQIPYGRTKRYGEIARITGASAQAVGKACGANPIPILIPCHRVLSSTGLGGFSGGQGVESKVILLRHEGAASLLL